MTLSKNFNQFLLNIDRKVTLLDELEYFIDPEKSVFVPTKSLEFLWHIIDSESMTVSLTRTKKEKIRVFCDYSLQQEQVTIREVARLLGMFASCFLAAPCGWLQENRTF